MSGVPELIPVLPAHVFDEDALARYLRSALPGFAGPLQVRQFQGGQSNPTYHLRTGDGAEYVRAVNSIEAAALPQSSARRSVWPG